MVINSFTYGHMVHVIGNVFTRPDIWVLSFHLALRERMANRGNGGRVKEVVERGSGGQGVDCDGYDGENWKG